MPRKLRVYRWLSLAIRGVKLSQSNLSYVVIVAATSKQEVARIIGKDRPSQLWNLTDTGNASEVATAMSKPGTVFYREDRYHDTPWTELACPFFARG